VPLEVCPKRLIYASSLKGLLQAELSAGMYSEESIMRLQVEVAQLVLADQEP
jgi:hypothetical protein